MKHARTVCGSISTVRSHFNSTGQPSVAMRVCWRTASSMKRSALEVIQSQEGPKTLFYLDPPYLPETRSSPDVYGIEMSTEDHVELL